MSRLLSFITIFLVTIFTPACRKNSLPTDTSSHRQNIFTANGAQLEYLDWGGEGPDLLLLAGLGNSAHLFDGFAPKLTEKYHVWGISRRAHGRSEVSKKGYGLDTLVADLKAFVDYQKINKVILMGHSFGG
ncbi:MAG: alpha/beta hydrolase [Bacteroidota bacterium]|nr:alpha/beta hydrolase [Bacteroidota bacterium]